LGGGEQRRRTGRKKKRCSAIKKREDVTPVLPQGRGIARGEKKGKAGLEWGGETANSTCMKKKTGLLQKNPEKKKGGTG